MSDSDDPAWGFETLAIHAGARPEPVTGARQTPIFQNTSYVFHDADHAASLFNLMEPGFVYSRLANPTNAVLEERLAALEGGVGGTAVATGHAAQVLALFPLMAPGCEVIAANKLYGGSLNQMGNSFKKFGWKAQFVDPEDPENFRRALSGDTRALFVESIANPGGVIVDLEAIAAVAHEAGVPFVVDNTMATPWLCRPIEFGADIVVNSTTKFLSGNGTSLGGAVVDTGDFPWLEHADKFPSLARPAPEYHGLTFAETFGTLAYTTYAHAVSLRDPRRQPAADERLAHPARAGDPAPAHGAALRQRARRRRMAGGPSGGRLGVLRRAAVEPVSQPAAALHAARRRLGLHLRAQGRL